MLFKLHILLCLFALASATNVINACPNQDFTFHALVVNFPLANITVTDPTSNGDGTWDVTIEFKAKDSMPLNSLTELKILSLAKTYMLHSHNLNVTAISDTGSWVQRVTVTPRTVGQYDTCMPLFTIQYDWCTTGVTNMEHCNTWPYQESYDYITGCDNFDSSTGYSQNDAPDYCWNIHESSSATASSSTLVSSSESSSTGITSESALVSSSLSSDESTSKLTWTEETISSGSSSSAAVSSDFNSLVSSLPLTSSSSTQESSISSANPSMTVPVPTFPSSSLSTIIESLATGSLQTLLSERSSAIQSTSIQQLSSLTETYVESKSTETAAVMTKTSYSSMSLSTSTYSTGDPAGTFHDVPTASVQPSPPAIENPSSSQTSFVSVSNGYASASEKLSTLPTKSDGESLSTGDGSFPQVTTSNAWGASSTATTLSTAMASFTSCNDNLCTIVSVSELPVTDSSTNTTFEPHLVTTVSTVLISSSDAKPLPLIVAPFEGGAQNFAVSRLGILMVMPFFFL